jgi:hypothetical protein
LLPPLEQAPDQIALRPPVTDKVTDVPMVNDADPLLPVATLIPAGLDVIRSPLRPLAFTVSDAVCAGGGGGGDAGVTVRLAVFETPFNVALIVTVVETVTVLVEIAKTALCEPAGTVTLAGTAAKPALVLESATLVAVVAAAARTTAPCALDPPATVAGLTARFVSVLDDEPGGLMVRFPVRVVPLYLAVIVTTVVAGTVAVAIVKLAVKLFAGAVVDADTLATAGWLLVSEITAPPSGAPELSTTVPLEESPPTTVAGLMSMEPRTAGGGACCGVKLRTADHGPATPAPFTPRTRQKWVVVARPLVAYIESVTDACRTRGAVNALESSI